MYCDLILKGLRPTFAVCYNPRGSRAMGKRSTDALRFVGIGWYVAACILLGTLGGRWLGQQFGGDGTVAILTIVGLLLGLAMAFLGIYRILRPLLSEGGQDHGSED